MDWLKKAQKYRACSDKVYDAKTGTYHCSHCGKIFDGEKVIYTLDHYLPESMNGMTNADNLFPVCLDCNRNRKDELVDGRDFYKFITKTAYEKMLLSISHNKVMKILQEKEKTLS